MPINPDFRHFYGREWRKVTRPRILARAGNKCEDCGAPNGLDLVRSGKLWRRWNPRKNRGRIGGKFMENPHLVRCVLTIAHLNHTPGDDRDENLKALCQWCHLNFDKDHHRESRATRKDAARPLLGTSNA